MAIGSITQLDFGGINCYLIKTAGNFILVDTVYPARRASLETKLTNAGCQPGNLDLILITHGDIDHSGNCAYLREKYGAKIAMHAGDLGMVERGDMNWNRKAKPDRQSWLGKFISRFGALFPPGKFEPFTPDLLIDESFDFAPYGIDAKILHLPGHSKGSIGILTAAGDLVCGDLIYHLFGKPGCPYIDDLADFNASIAKLKKLAIKMVYPGHGKPFLMEEFK